MGQSSMTTALDRILDPLSDCLNTEVAQHIVELRPIEPDIQTAIEQLADRCNEGSLAGQEA